MKEVCRAHSLEVSTMKQVLLEGLVSFISALSKTDIDGSESFGNSIGEDC